MTTRIADAITAACREIRSGALYGEFVVDIIQGGAGRAAPSWSSRRA
ncbi:hypothetical protein [Amycolatopsis sp. cmx-4-68]